MAGYNYNTWTSNNAVEARADRGLMSASELAKDIGVSTRAIADCMVPCERHHTGSKYQLTAFYNPDAVTPALLEEMKAFDIANKQSRSKEPVSRNCNVFWLEFVKQPGRKTKAIEHKWENIKVEFYEGTTNVVIYRPDGAPINKRYPKGGTSYLTITPVATLEVQDEPPTTVEPSI